MNSHCIYGCKTDGRPCPRPHTCRTIAPKLAEQRAIDEQAKTDRQAAKNSAQDDGDEYGGVDEIIVDGIAVALIVWLVACIFAPALAWYLTHIRG